MPNIFTALFKPKPTADSVTFTQPFTFGKSTSGVDVTERTALNTSAVYACVRVVSEAIASLPLRVYKDTGNGLERSPDHLLYDILHDSPNPDMTSFVFWEVLMSHLLLYGNCFAQIVRNGLHQVTGLYPLLPNKIEMNRDENGELFYTYQLDYNEPNPNHDRQTVILPKSEVLHIRGLSHDGLFGYSPVKINRNAIGMAVATENYGASFFANGANPSGVLQHTGKINSTEAIRESWEKLLKGRGSNRVAFLEDGMTYKPIGIPPEQAQFLETRKFQLSEIARIFRVPPHMIGDLERSTFSNKANPYEMWICFDSGNRCLPLSAASVAV